MDPDDLTIGEAKRLVALLAPLLGVPPTGGPATTTKPPLVEVGARVLIRANNAGVWAGTVLACDGDRVSLLGRRLWSWTGALDCSHLAVEGPTGGRISAETRVILGSSAEIVEVHALTDAAAAAVAGVRPWQR